MRTTDSARNLVGRLLLHAAGCCDEQLAADLHEAARRLDAAGGGYVGPCLAGCGQHIAGRSGVNGLCRACYKAESRARAARRALTWEVL